MLQKMRMKRERMALAPDKEFMKDENLAYIPYTTIEYVFNDKNVWGNVQNEHPAFIYYDFECEWQWKCCFGSETPIIPVDKDVSISGALKQHMCDGMARELIGELCESIRMYRAKNGLDTNIDENKELLAMLEKRIEMLEEKSQLDPDLFDGDRTLVDLPDAPMHADFSPNVRDKVLYTGYDSKQKKAWKKVLSEAERLKTQFDDNFPVKRGMQFQGYPIHFCTSSADRIREYLLNWPEFLDMLHKVDDRVHFVVVAKMFPLPSGVLSLWFVLGIEEPVVVPT